MRKRPPMTPAEIDGIFFYNPTTGRFFHRLDSPRCKAGDRAGAMQAGHYTLQLAGVRFRASDIAYYMQTGEWAETVLLDGNPKNLKWSNIGAINLPEREGIACRLTYDPTTLEVTCHFTKPVPPEASKIVSEAFRAAVEGLTLS